MKRIGVVAAVYGALGPAKACFQKRWPEVQTVDLYDEHLYQLYHRENRITDEMYVRVRRLLQLGADSGVDGLLFSGSLWTKCVKACRDDFDIPVLAAYECLIDKVITSPRDSRLSLLASEPGTITSFEKDFSEACAGKLALKPIYIDNAMSLLGTGNRLANDELIIEAGQSLTESDVILLAQYSMESVAERLSQATGKTVYGSLGCAADRLKSLIVG